MSGRCPDPSPVLLIDNRDSFTLNIAHAFAELGEDVAIIDGRVVDSTPDLSSLVQHLAPILVCVGPGPRGPEDLPALVRFVDELVGVLPLFGICLGMQALTLARGGRVKRARVPVHGKRRFIEHHQKEVFDGLPSPLAVMRYHSLVCDVQNTGLEVTAWCEGETMAVADPNLPVSAVQFHPESVGTAGGLVMLHNVLVRAGRESMPPSERQTLGRLGAVPPVSENRLGSPLASGSGARSPTVGAGRIRWMKPIAGRLSHCDPHHRAR